MGAPKLTPRQQRLDAVLMALRSASAPMDLRALGEATGLDHTTLHNLLNELVAHRQAKRFEAPRDARALQHKQTHFVWIPA